MEPGPNDLRSFPMTLARIAVRVGLILRGRWRLILRGSKLETASLLALAMVRDGGMQGFNVLVGA